MQLNPILIKISRGSSTVYAPYARVRRSGASSNRFYLGHGIQVDADKDEQRGSAEQIRHLAREIEKLLHQRWNKRNECKVERTWQNNTIELPL